MVRLMLFQLNFFRFSSVKGEVIPQIINSQFRSEDPAQAQNGSSLSTEEEKEKGTINILDFWTPKMFAVITLKFIQRSFYR